MGEAELCLDLARQLGFGAYWVRAWSHGGENGWAVGVRPLHGRARRFYEKNGALLAICHLAAATYGPGRRPQDATDAQEDQ